MFWAVVWIVCGLCAAAVYNQKGRSGLLGLVGGFVLGPLGLLLALCSSKKEE